MKRKFGEFDTHRKYWTQKVQTEIKRNLPCHLVYMEFKMTCGTDSKTVNTKDLQWIGSRGDPDPDDILLYLSKYKYLLILKEKEKVYVAT